METKKIIPNNMKVRVLSSPLPTDYLKSIALKLPSFGTFVILIRVVLRQK